MTTLKGQLAAPEALGRHIRDLVLRAVQPVESKAAPHSPSADGRHTEIPRQPSLNVIKDVADLPGLSYLASGMQGIENRSVFPMRRTGKIVPPRLLQFSKSSWGPYFGKTSKAIWEGLNDAIKLPHPTKELKKSRSTLFPVCAWWVDDHGGGEGTAMLTGVTLGTAFAIPIALDAALLPVRLLGIPPTNAVKWEMGKGYALTGPLWVALQPVSFAVGAGGTLLDVASAPHRLIGIGPNGTKWFPREPQFDKKASDHNSLLEEYKKLSDKFIKEINRLIEERNTRLRSELASWNRNPDDPPPRQPAVATKFSAYRYGAAGNQVEVEIELRNDGDGAAHKVSFFLTDARGSEYWNLAEATPSAQVTWLDAGKSEQVVVSANLPPGRLAGSDDKVDFRLRVCDGWGDLARDLTFRIYLAPDEPKLGPVVDHAGAQ